VRVLVDTNRYRDFCAGVPDVVELFRSAELIHLPFVSLAELRAGFLHGSLAKKNERTLSLFLGRTRVKILWPDDGTTHHYARLYLQLRRQGTPIPTNDLWIAALAAQHDLTLCSRDAHFDSLPQLARA
jgi:tRNA(fMet)-specific endonuclease VapC